MQDLTYSFDLCVVLKNLHAFLEDADEFGPADAPRRQRLQDRIDEVRWLLDGMDAAGIERSVGDGRLFEGVRLTRASDSNILWACSRGERVDGTRFAIATTELAFQPTMNAPGSTKETKHTCTLVFYDGELAFMTPSGDKAYNSFLAAASPFNCVSDLRYRDLALANAPRLGRVLLEFIAAFAAAG